MPNQSIAVEKRDAGKRLDAHLARILADRLSRSQLKKIIENGSVKINGREVSAHYRIKPGETIEIEWTDRPPDETRAEDIPLHVIAEDDEILVVNKPAGMVVHPAHGNPSHTLVNALLYHVRGLSQVGGPVRPGLVHRLDKDTSGIMVIAKNDRVHAFLARQFKNQTIERFYRVVVRGVVQHDEGICEEPVGRAFLNRKKVVVRPSGGKEALTYYRVFKRFSEATFLEVRPRTGRTHQIRVHMAHLGHPVLGDLLYGIASPGISRQAVHAFALRFVHPKTREKVYYECPLPADFQRLLAYLE